MDISTYARQTQADMGWTDATLLSVCLDYIEDQTSDDAFKDYLGEIRAAEQAPEWFPGDEFICHEDQVDDGDEGERVTPAGSVWEIQGHLSQDGDYEATCQETGGWLHFPAAMLADKTKCTRVE